LHKIFVTGTDTDVGKTVVSSWLVYHLKADYWKPIQTGHDLDKNTVQRLAHIPDSECTQRIKQSVYQLNSPLSPHAAAELENVTIDIDKISAPESNNSMIIEGAGGVLVPLTKKLFMIDLIKKLNMPVIVVARSTLGTINHTCLTLEALRAKNIPVIGVVMSGTPNPSNKQAIEHYGKVKVIAEIPHTDVTNIAFPLCIYGLCERN